MLTKQDKNEIAQGLRQMIREEIKAELREMQQGGAPGKSQVTPEHKQSKDDVDVSGVRMEKSFFDRFTSSEESFA